MATSAPNVFKTGPAEGIKSGAVNAAKAVLDKYNSEKEEVQKEIMSIPEGTIVFSTVGEPVFNCYAAGKTRISFKAGKYLVYPDTKNREAILAALEYHVEQGRITKS